MVNYYLCHKCGNIDDIKLIGPIQSFPRSVGHILSENFLAKIVDKCGIPKDYCLAYTDKYKFECVECKNHDILEFDTEEVRERYIMKHMDDNGKWHVKELSSKRWNSKLVEKFVIKKLSG